MTADAYRCPTPCDEDCEISAWGCHESHVPTWKRAHEPMACESRALAANLTWLFDSGWFTQIGSSNVPEGHSPAFFAALHKPGEKPRAEATFNGGSVAEAAGKAAEWARQAKAEPAPANGCRGFQWIGQTFASCDGCGRPAWEHDGMLRLREGAKLTSIGDDEGWEVVPWEPGQPELIKRRWER